MMCFVCCDVGLCKQPVEEMDGAHFQKLCRDSDLLGRHLSTTDVDLIFAKVCRQL
jgi:hypothetical protein